MAKKEARQEPGNRKWKGTDLLTMQETYLSLIEGFHAQYGNHIISGCGLTGTNLSPGLVMLEGKACYFVGATGVTGAYYVRKVVVTENVEYELTPPNLGWENYIAEVCAVGDAGAFRLDNAPRFTDVLKPKNAVHADSATDADTVDGQHANDLATSAQGSKADSAVQNATIGAVQVSKVGSLLQFPAYPTILPANGGNADTVDNVHAAEMMSVGAYNYTGGWLVRFKWPSNKSVMGIVSIYGNGYASQLPINTLVQFYLFSDDSKWYNYTAINYGRQLGVINLFFYQGHIYMQLENMGMYETLKFYAESAVDNTNMVETVTQSDVPSSGISNLVVVPSRNAVLAEANGDIIAFKR